MMIKTIHPEAFMWASELQLQNIARTCAGLDLRTQEPLSRHTSFRTGGPAALMAFPRTPEELQLLLRSAAAEGRRAVSARRGDERSGAGRWDCRRWSSA